MHSWDCFLIMADSVKALFRAAVSIDLPEPVVPLVGKRVLTPVWTSVLHNSYCRFNQFNYTLFTVPYFSIRLSRSSALRYRSSSWMPEARSLRTYETKMAAHTGKRSILTILQKRITIPFTWITIY